MPGLSWKSQRLSSRPIFPENTWEIHWNYRLRCPVEFFQVSMSTNEWKKKSWYFQYNLKKSRKNKDFCVIASKMFSIVNFVRIYCSVSRISQPLILDSSREKSGKIRCFLHLIFTSWMDGRPVATLKSIVTQPLDRPREIPQGRRARVFRSKKLVCDAWIFRYFS